MRLLAALAFALLASGAGADELPRNFLYMGSGDLPAAEDLLARPDIAGVQVIYNWRALEPTEGEYDFSAIEADLAVAEAHGKELFIQIQDRFFSVKARHLPDYLLEDPAYAGGLVPQIDDPEAATPVTVGWTAIQWNAPLRARFQALLTALADRFDGRIFGINLPETSIELDPKADNAGFSAMPISPPRWTTSPSPGRHSRARMSSSTSISGPASGTTTTTTWAVSSPLPPGTASG